MTDVPDEVDHIRLAPITDRCTFVRVSSISSSAEEPTSDHVSLREKNRLSYAHQNFIVDLTQVTVPEKVRSSTNCFRR